MTKRVKNRIASDSTVIFIVQGVISGALRATGRQAKAAFVNFLSYYVVGLPLGITLALVVKLGTKGMWIGLSVADTIQVRACVQTELVSLTVPSLL